MSSSGGVKMRKLTIGKRKGKNAKRVRKPNSSWKDNPWILQLLDPSLVTNLNYNADACMQKPLKYNTLGDALTRIASQFQIPLEHWIERSRLFRDALFQRRITDYLRG
jgi:hypothetical protein